MVNREDYLNNSHTTPSLNVVCNAMKIKIITILLINLTVLSYGQKVKKINVKFYKSKQISQSFYVLKSDKKIKHGEYISYFRLSKIDFNLVEDGHKDLADYIKEKGNYSNGKKVGIWETYQTGLKISSFDYDKNKKVGIWLTKRENGKVYEQFDYDNNIQLQPIISVPISYPNIARENGIQGVVKLKYQITSECLIEKITVTQSVSPECDQEAIKSMNKYGELLKKYSINCDAKNEEKEFKFKLL
ncbi:MAG: energy transducer TonB [Bacteroidales bacterium]|nr:energy transducer TonB [Bacteroidales bacterium]